MHNGNAQKFAYTAKGLQVGATHDTQHVHCPVIHANDCTSAVRGEVVRGYVVILLAELADHVTVADSFCDQDPVLDAAQEHPAGAGLGRALGVNELCLGDAEVVEAARALVGKEHFPR